MNTSSTVTRTTRFDPITSWDAVRPPVGVQTTQSQSSVVVGLTAE